MNKPILWLLMLVVAILLIPFLFSVFDDPPEDLFGTANPTTRTATLLSDYVVNDDDNLVTNRVPDLGLTVDECTLYHGLAFFYMDSDHSSGGLRYDWDYPSDANARRISEDWSSTFRQTATMSTDLLLGTAVVRYVAITFRLDSISRGTLQVRFAQNTAYASDSTMLAGSHFFLTRVGASTQIGC